MATEAVLSRVLQELLRNLSSPVQDQLGLLLGARTERQRLESNLSTIRAVLQDAERRQENDMAVRDWLRKLKDAACDAEDLVDEFKIEALRRKAVNQGGMLKKGLVGSLFFPFVFRFKMANKMRELRERCNDIAKERNDFHFKVGVIESPPPISTTRETCSYVIESEVYGRDKEREKLIDSLINSGNESVLSIIPIVGMGGLGKTTLAQLVYNDERLATHFDLKMWVYVSENYPTTKLLKEILQSAVKCSIEELSMDLSLARLQETLGGKRFLLVLDDVWTEVYRGWDILKTWLHCGAMGSKILVTTRSHKVVSILHTLPAHYLGTLPEEDSWTLFEKLARPHPNLTSIGKEMVEKCGGLPLAVKTLGGLMSSKTTESEWQSIKNSEFWTLEDNDGRILPILRLSYDHLTPSLKQCFAYCSIIPKRHRIDKDKLIKQWIAQGLIHSNGKNELLEEKGEGYFNELLRRSLFQVDVGQYKRHDLIHDLLTSVTGKECFVVEYEFDDIDPIGIHHLLLRAHKWARDRKHSKALRECKKLRSFLLPFCSIDFDICMSLKCLRVLDLSCTDIGYLPNSVDKLKHLRYLDVSYTFIEKLPERICELHSLQTLIIVSTPLRKLPKNMKRMISLRHIEFDVAQYFPVPKGIGELSSLRTLSKFVVIKERGHGIEELKGLNQLSGNIRIEGLGNTNSEYAHEAIYV